MSSIDADDARLEKIQSLLTRAAQLPAGERDVFLSRECGEDEALRAQVYELLLAESRGLAVKKLAGRPGPVTSAVQQALSGSAQDRRVELLGKVIGDYRLVAIVGVGGVGTVYLGERADRAYSAQVAIKVVANSQLSHEVQRRFAAERQILANLNHPYIGRLLDAGETFFDEPYLVMEYVHGEAIDRYCDNQRLSVLERIELFLKVCDAVQYAHRNLIVHRDLKPGNILVSKEGIPKLLDFGIAKLLDESAQAVLQDGVVAHTRVHDRLLTPEYASPEQIRGQPVTTTSDVYALGIILYELLTGVRPYAVNAHNQLELERSICIQDPLKPSQMAAALGKNIPSPPPLIKDANLIPIARKTTFTKLEAQLKGDLDAIVMKALRKEPEHRYSSVEHLIEDIQRHLTKEPVEARQGNRWYYTQRFIKRHTLGVISASAALMSLVAVAIILSIQATRLKEQRDIATQQRDIANGERDKATMETSRAKSVSKFMEEVLAAADPLQSQDKQTTAKELLDSAAKKIEGDNTQQPEVRAELLFLIGKTFARQARPAISIDYLNSSIEIQRSLQKRTKLLGETLDYLGRAYQDLGELNKAHLALSEAQTILEDLNLTKSKEYLQVLNDRAGLEHIQSHIEVSEVYGKKALKLSRELYGNFHTETAGTLMQLSQLMIWKSQINEAEKNIREVIDIYRHLLPDKHPDRILADLNLGDILIFKGRYSEAEKQVEGVLSDQIAVYGAGNAHLLQAYDSLLKAQLGSGKIAEAERNILMQLKISKRNYGLHNINTGVIYTSFAKVKLQKQDFASAERYSRMSLEILHVVISNDHQYVASAEYLLAASLVGQHKSKDAEPLLRENMARWTRAEAPSWRAARSESLLGIALLQLHKPSEAKHYLMHADEVLSAKDSGSLPDEVTASRKRVEGFKRCEAKHRLDNCELEI